MKIHCNHCHKTYSADANLKAVPGSAPEELNGQWSTICPFCHEETLTDIEQKSIYAILSEDDIDNRHFEDFFDGECVKEAFGFDTVEEFITWWEKAVDDQPSMWYHVIRNGIQICAGAIDPYDIDIFRENFPELNRMTNLDIAAIFEAANLDDIVLNDKIHEIYEASCNDDCISIGVSFENQSEDADMPATGYIINLFHNQQYVNFPGFYSKDQLLHDAKLHENLANAWNACWSD